MQSFYNGNIDIFSYDNDAEQHCASCFVFPSPSISISTNGRNESRNRHRPPLQELFSLGGKRGGNKNDLLCSCYDISLLQDKYLFICHGYICLRDPS